MLALFLLFTQLKSSVVWTKRYLNTPCLLNRDSIFIFHGNVTKAAVAVLHFSPQTLKNVFKILFG